MITKNKITPVQICCTKGFYNELNRLIEYNAKILNTPQNNLLTVESMSPLILCIHGATKPDILQKGEIYSMISSISQYCPSPNMDISYVKSIQYLINNGSNVNEILSSY